MRSDARPQANPRVTFHGSWERAEHDADGRRSFAAVERSISDRLLATNHPRTGCDAATSKRRSGRMSARKVRSSQRPSLVRSWTNLGRGALELRSVSMTSKPLSTSRVRPRVDYRSCLEALSRSKGSPRPSGGFPQQAHAFKAAPIGLCAQRTHPAVDPLLEWIGCATRHTE